MGWNKIIIDVDYQPCDPGITNTFSERTEVNRSDLKPGLSIAYKDPSGLFPSILVKEIDDQGITLQAGKREYRFEDVNGRRTAKMGKTGRDYTYFWLWAALVSDENSDL